MDAENAHDEVIVIAENQNNEASSSSSGDKVDEVGKNGTSNDKVDEVDSNQRDDTSEVTSNVVPKGKNKEVPQECDSTAHVKQMTKTPEQQQLSDAPEPAVQVVDDQDDGTVEQAGEEPAVQLDGGQAGDEPANQEPAVQPETVEQAGDEPAKGEQAVQLDEAPLDETQPVV